MHGDPFTSLLSLVNVRSEVAGGLAAGGDWAVRFPPPDRIKFFIAARGGCWLRVDGEEPVRFEVGDVLMLTAPRPFLLGSDLSLPSLDAYALFESAGSPISTVGDGQDFFMLGGHADLDSACGKALLESLPDIIHLPAGSIETDTVQWLIDRLVCEHHASQPGAAFAVTQLAQLMFLHILRGYLAAAGTPMAGRLRAVSDPRIAPAIRLMHQSPGHGWQLAELARACAMSRTVFAGYFKSVAGVAPLAYLTQWRMQLAERALRDSDTPLAALSESLGYSSESAFSIAFKRVMGTAPQRYRSAARAQAASTTTPALDYAGTGADLALAPAQPPTD